ncbi:hypothetical protein [Vibrio sp. SCSIO 43136]|uniref:hypothetical protein n=1 Tax=Vibrio sp. SCSIO 43136 TaxID=2819101 RepID=UPI002075030B|nr:hypothetical protein [Vibrio sp. SCSIO 43136]USD67122.1 hypothetical protein J4N39_21030 [Vibrio sp. SCSIO 43136]
MEINSTVNDEFFSYRLFKEKELEGCTVIFKWSATPTRELYSLIMTGALVLISISIFFWGLIALEEDEYYLATLNLVIWSFITSYFHNTVFKPMTYEYELSNKGVRFKEICNVSEGYYKVLRGGGAVGILVCIIAFFVIGPLAFVGAGAYALYAPKMATVQRIVNHKCFVLPNRCILRYYRKRMKVAIFPTDDFPLNGRDWFWYSSLDDTYIEPKQFYQLITHLRILGILVEVEEVHSNKELWK